MEIMSTKAPNSERKVLAFGDTGPFSVVAAAVVVVSSWCRTRLLSLALWVS